MGERLVDKLDLTVGEILRWDLAGGLLGGIGSGWLQAEHSGAASSALPVAAGIVGVVIGAVVGGVAIIAAFMDTDFIKKIHQINKEPGRYITPFVFTALIGVFGALLLVIDAALPASAPPGLKDVIAGIAGFLTIWTLLSVVQLLSTLMDFVALKGDAAEVELPETGPSAREARASVVDIQEPKRR
jgi:hypothetical protein